MTASTETLGMQIYGDKSTSSSCQGLGMGAGKEITTAIDGEQEGFLCGGCTNLKSDKIAWKYTDAQINKMGETGIRLMYYINVSFLVMGLYYSNVRCQH